MLVDSLLAEHDIDNTKRDLYLENYHKRHYSLVLWVLLTGIIVFIVWASYFRIDQVAKGTGEVITSSRVQIIQSVDGGVISNIYVREGDTVAAGDVIATLDTSRVGASVKEVDARLAALKAKAIRLRAEIIGNDELVFDDDLLRFPEQIKVEKALFKQKRTTLVEELHALQIAVDLAKEESELIKKLSLSGDVDRSEIIKAARNLNDSQAKLLNRKNTYLEDAGAELTKAEDEIAQNQQILMQRKEQLDDSTFKALVPGIIKNVRVTTIGGVLRAGEELMQIIPLDDELIIEAKVRPADIAQVRKGLSATIRFDPFDYTIYGGVVGEVVYVSADTLKEDTRQGEEIYYRVHISTKTSEVMTTSGKVLDILPGMTAQVDIKTSDRTVLNYLLKPLRKTLAESFGER